MARKLSKAEILNLRSMNVWLIVLLANQPILYNNLQNPNDKWELLDQEDVDF
jgi:hypothetical protein